MCVDALFYRGRSGVSIDEALKQCKMGYTKNLIQEPIFR